jgi:hypothetical protein
VELTCVAVSVAAAQCVVCWVGHGAAAAHRSCGGGSGSITTRYISPHPPSPSICTTTGRTTTNISYIIDAHCNSIIDQWRTDFVGILFADGSTSNQQCLNQIEPRHHLERPSQHSTGASAMLW